MTTPTEQQQIEPGAPVGELPVEAEKWLTSLKLGIEAGDPKHVLLGDLARVREALAPQAAPTSMFVREKARARLRDMVADARGDEPHIPLPPAPDGFYEGFEDGYVQGHSDALRAARQAPQAEPVTWEEIRALHVEAGALPPFHNKPVAWEVVGRKALLLLNRFAAPQSGQAPQAAAPASLLREARDALDWACDQLDLCPDTVAELVKRIDAALAAPQAAVVPLGEGFGRWIGCGECDVSFPCHEGMKRCFRLDSPGEVG